MPEVIGPDGVGREMEPELAGEVMRRVFEGAFREMMGGVMLPAPGADPGFRGEITPGMIGERLGRGVPEGFLTEPVRTEVTPELVEKVYRVAEEAGFASGGLLGAKFKELYPTFKAYKQAMADMKIPLDEVVKQRAKGPSYHSIPATEAEYLARIGESSSLMDSIRSLQPKGQERALVSISELRDKAVGKVVDFSHLKEDAIAIAKEYDMPLKSVEHKITKGSSTTGGLNYLKEGKIKVATEYGTEAAYMELAHELAHFVERGHNKSFEAIHKEIYEKLIARNKGSDWTKDASFEPKIVESSKGKMTNAEFDAQLLKLAQEGKVVLHPHDFASSLKPEQRAKLLAIPNKDAYWGGHDYYVGVVPK